MSFIYCIDKALANKLKSDGCLLLQETKIGNKQTWIFNGLKKVNFSKEDKNKYFLSNKLNF